jgi:hypothetical protein
VGHRGAESKRRTSTRERGIEGGKIEFQQVGHLFAFAGITHWQVQSLRKGYGDAAFGRAVELVNLKA